MTDAPITNENRSFNPVNEGDSKLDKSTELNSSMSITASAADEYTTTIHSGRM